MRRGILATRDELAALSDKTGRQPFGRFYDYLLERCDMILQTPPITETYWRNLYQQGSWAPAVQAGADCQGRMLDLLVAAHVDENQAYRDRAIEELMNLSAWSTWTDPCHTQAPADLATGEAAATAALAMDWLYEDLSQHQRETVLHAIETKAFGPYLASVEQGAFWCECYHNWNAVVNGGMGVAALALTDELPAAADVYRAARLGLTHYTDAIAHDGSWDEGVGYWGFGMRYLMLLAEACRRIDDDQSLLHIRGLSQTGLFPVYFCPNGQAASFGDSPSVPAMAAFYLLVGHFDCKPLATWLDSHILRDDATPTGRKSAGLALLLRPDGLKLPETSELEPVKDFEIGWAAMADSWPKPRLYVAAKTGDLAANHSQHDMNSIQIMVDGEMLLTDIGSAPYSRDYFSEKRHEFYEAQAQAHNTITLGERNHMIDAQGRILTARADENYRWVACDAGEACGEAARFQRHVVMLVPDGKTGQSVVVLDEVDTAVPETADLYWHSKGAIRLTAGTKDGSILGQRAGVYFAIRSTAGGAIRTARHNQDHFLQLSAGVMGRAYFLSVFSRTEIAEPVDVKPTADGVKVDVGETQIHFASTHNGLVLKEMTGTD